METKSQTVYKDRPFKGTRTEFLRSIIDLIEAANSSIRKTITTHHKLAYSMNSDNFRLRRMNEFLLQNFNVKLEYFFLDDDGGRIPVPPKYEGAFLGFLRGGIKYRKMSLERLAFDSRFYIYNLRNALFTLDDLSLDKLFMIAKALRLNVGVNVVVPALSENEPGRVPGKKEDFSPALFLNAKVQTRFDVDPVLAATETIGLEDYREFSSKKRKKDSENQ